MTISRVGTAIAVIACVLAGSAKAQRGRQAEAEAEILFKQGKAEMAKGNFAVACEKFQSSQELDPRASTLMNLGACQEAAKKLVSAWYAFVEAAKLADRSADDKGLAGTSRKRRDALEPRLSSLKIVVSSDARVAGLEVLRDGVPVVEGQWNSDVFVDGGEYEIIARAPGSTAWTARISVASELDRKTIEIPRLTLDPGAVPAPDAGQGGASRSPPAGEPPPTPPRAAPGMFTGLRKLAVGVTALGVVAVAGGAVFGARSSDLADRSDAICPTTTCDDPEGLRLNRDARSSASRANLLIIGGAVAVAGGVALWLVGGPSRSGGDELSLAPLVGGDAVGLTVAGGF